MTSNFETFCLVRLPFECTLEQHLSTKEQSVLSEHALLSDLVLLCHTAKQVFNLLTLATSRFSALMVFFVR